MSNSYITLKASKIGLDPSDLEPVWNDSTNYVRETYPTLSHKDPSFVSKVMDAFDKKVDTFYLEKARRLIMQKEQVKRHGQEWVNALAKGNYVMASEAFPKLVQSSLDGLIDVESKEFLKKFADKIKNQQ